MMKKKKKTISLESSADYNKLSDYPDGNLDVAKNQGGATSGKEAGQPRPKGRTISEATDPSKLSDI